MIASLLFVAAVTATFHPARPTVGDLVTVEFREPVRLDPSTQYEVVSQRGTRVVLRTFDPHPLLLSGVAGETRFRNLVLPVRSVLKPRDPMQPAPLEPPRATPYQRLPFIALPIAALAAALAWVVAYVVARRKEPLPEIIIPPAVAYREAVEALRRNRRAPARWAALADATRRYLAARGYGSDLTTTQLLQRLDEAPRGRHQYDRASQSQSGSQTSAPHPAFGHPLPTLWGEGFSIQNAPTAASEGEVPSTSLGASPSTSLGASPSTRPGAGTGAPRLIAEILHLGDLEKFSPWGASPADFDALARRALEIPDFFEPPPVPEEEAAA